MKFYRTTVGVKIDLKPNPLGSYKKAIADYMPVSGEPLPIIVSDNSLLTHRGEWQPDLLYISSILVSEGRNDNGDGFLRPKLVAIYDTPVNKFVDYEHDPDGGNKSGHNPDKYQIVGHIYESAISLQKDGSVIPSSQIYKDNDHRWFPVNSKWRDTPIDLRVAWVLYKFQFPELADLIEKFTVDSPEKFGVSMEVLFSDFKYRVGSFDVTEEFNYDATKDGKIEAKKDTPFADELGELWRARKQYNGQDITRILGGTMFFSGMAITKNRANRRSVNLSIASQIEQEMQSIQEAKEETELIKLIKNVASKNSDLDLQKCELFDGEPSCGCIENAISSQVEVLGAALADLSEAIQKRKDTNPKEGEHKYGSVKFADEKNKKYPIDTPEHIRAAWNYIHKEHNSGKYSSEDVKSIKEKILSAWKEHVSKDGPPSAEASDVGQENGPARKGDEWITGENGSIWGLYYDNFGVGEMIDFVEDIDKEVKKMTLEIEKTMGELS